MDEIYTAVAFYSEDFNAHFINGFMKERGWRLYSMQKPSALFMQFTNASAHQAGLFVKDLREVVEEMSKDLSRYQERTAGSYTTGDSSVASVAKDHELEERSNIMLDSRFTVRGL